MLVHKTYPCCQSHGWRELKYMNEFQTVLSILEIKSIYLLIVSTYGPVRHLISESRQLLRCMSETSY